MDISFQADAFNSSYWDIAKCEEQGGPLIEQSSAWLRKPLRELNIPTEG